MIKLKPLLANIFISLAVGGLSGLITRNSMDTYDNITRPPLAPPAIVFPIVWGILFLLMGISAYLIYVSGSPNTKRALTVYAVQLAVNFVWPILYFTAKQFTLAFIWLLLLWVLVAVMIREFKKIKPAAGYLQIPYIVWLTFAAYLNLGTAILN